MLLKNKITGSIGQFENPQGENWIELTRPELLNFNINQLRQKLIVEKKAQLISTDWYVNRFIKRGVPIPQWVIDQDIKVVAEIDKIEKTSAIEELLQL